MSKVTSKVFRSGNSEAVRLPKEVAFGEDVEVTIERHGDVLTIYPARLNGRRLVERLRNLPAPDEIGARDEIEIPERPGL